jgi:hypothetical protein
MSIFDLLFIAVFLASLITLLTAAILAIQGRIRRSLRILRLCGICIGFYLGAVMITSLILPREILKIGDPKCFDDWCISVTKLRRLSDRAGLSYEVTFQLSSRARRVSQRENGMAAFITDDQGHRFDSVADQSAVPFNVMLQPQESVTAIRTFDLPAGVSQPGLVITHAGGFPIGWFIIGYETWFRKPAILPLRE